MSECRFSSKAAMIAFCKQVLNSYEAGDVLRDTDLEIVLELINRHPKAKEKIGCGIKEIMIRKDPVWKKTKQFWIIRNDGSGIDFSYKKCINGEPASIDTFRAACRTAVANDIFKFKLAELQKNPICPFRNTPLDVDNSHVDHVMPKTLNALVDMFIKDNNLDVEQVEIYGATQKQFKDMDIAYKFVEFHRQHADLELVSAEANQCECKKRI